MHDFLAVAAKRAIEDQELKKKDGERMRVIRDCEKFSSSSAPHLSVVCTAPARASEVARSKFQKPVSIADAAIYLSKQV